MSAPKIQLEQIKPVKLQFKNTHQNVAKAKIQLEQLNKVNYLTDQLLTDPANAEKSDQETKIELEQVKTVKYQPEVKVNPVKYQQEIQLKSIDDDPESLHLPLPLVTFGTSLGLGLIGTILFDGQNWGLSIALFSFFLIFSLLALNMLAQQSLAYSEYLLITSGFFFAMTFAWRKSLILNGLSGFSLFLTIYLAYSLGTRQKLPALGISEAFQDVWHLFKYILSSYYKLLAEDVRWHLIQQYWKPVGQAIFRGLLISIPLLLIFTVLLTSAEFRNNIYASTSDWSDWKTIARYVITFILCSWTAVAVLRGSVLNRGLIQSPRLNLPTWKLGTIETMMILSAINLLLVVAFVTGDAFMGFSNQLTDAISVRQDVFYLVAIVLLVIGLLLMTQWLYKTANQNEAKMYQFLAALMILMTIILELAVMHRLHIYTDAYGWAETDFYLLIFLRWLIVIVIWFAITLLRGKRIYFIFGTIVTTLFFIGILHSANPDARIAEVNLARLQTKQTYDMNVITSLSADAFPTLLEKLPTLPKSPRCHLWQHLQTHPQGVLQKLNSWRDWHWAHQKTQEAFQKTQQTVLVSLPKFDCP
jgi:hypothetical protein